MWRARTSDTFCLPGATESFVGEVDFWLGFSFGFTFSQILRQVRTYCVRYAQKCPVLGAGLRGGFLAFFNPLRVKEQSSLIFAGRIVGYSSDAWVIGLCGES